MIGIFGGAFDPPHQEHVSIVKGLLKSGRFEKIVLLPSGNSPHKDHVSPFSARKKMIEEAYKGVSVEIDETETTFEGRAYSSCVLPVLKKKYGEIGFIIGGDSLLAFRSWHEPKEVLKVCPIFVVPRGDEEISDLRAFALELTKEFGGQITVVEDVKGRAVSSSVLRAAIALGADAPDLPKGVKEIALAENLYAEKKAMAEKVKAALPEKRWNHTCGVVLTGIEMAEKFGVDKEKAFVACLLHDCMKYSEVVHKGVPEDAIGTKVLHAFNGAEEAKIAYGVTDEDVINAVRYHTTGRAAMSDLEKLVYLADVVEPNRHYAGVEEIRAAAFRNLDEGFVLSLKRSYELLLQTGKPVYYLTVECYNYYCK